jgi:hypothetical protein
VVSQPTAINSGSETTAQQIGDNAPAVHENENNRASEVTHEPAFEPAIRILRQRQRNGKPEFLVLFETKERCWADQISPALERAFRIQHEQLRNKRRRRRKRY